MKAIICIGGLTGIKNKKQLYGNMDALGWHLCDVDIEQLEKISK